MRRHLDAGKCWRTEIAARVLVPRMLIYILGWCTSRSEAAAHLNCRQGLARVLAGDTRQSRSNFGRAQMLANAVALRAMWVLIRVPLALIYSVSDAYTSAHLMQRVCFGG